LIGSLGGLLGALFVKLNTKINLWRKKRLNTKWKKFFEPVGIAAIGALFFFFLPMFFPKECHSDKDVVIQGIDLLRYNCDADEFNALATLTFNT